MSQLNLDDNEYPSQKDIINDFENPNEDNNPPPIFYTKDEVDELLLNSITAIATKVDNQTQESIDTSIDYTQGQQAIKKYVALLTQTGTNAPVATVLENTLSGTPVWTRLTTGTYRMSLANEFTVGKTMGFIHNYSSNPGVSYGFLSIGINADFINIKTNQDGVGTDAIFLGCCIEIRVYP